MLYFECEKVCCCDSQRLIQEVAFFFLTFQTFKLIPESCLHIKDSIGANSPLLALEEYNFLKCYMYWRNLSIDFAKFSGI